MNRASQVFTGTLLLAIGLVVGYSVGYKHGFGWRATLESLEQAHYEAFAKIQGEAGSIESKEEVLNQFIALTEKRASSFSPTFSQKTYAVDMALSYARLSMLAKQKGNLEQADAYIKQAAGYCPKIGWEQCNPEIIISFTQKADAIGKKQ